MRTNAVNKKHQQFTCKKLPLCAAIALLTPLAYVQPVLAGPEGGQVVGGRGSISQTGSATIINQNTQRMAIDWNSYNVGADERVQYIQPNSSSLSLNRILSHQGSQIHGRIDANGQVLLVNPNGIVFGNGAQVNVGGLLATGLSINPDDFMNGRFTFDAIEGKDGVVINSGTLNAATGGSISLVGKRIENNGLIQADLGRINLASGKKAILSFDGGLMGIRVSEALLQDELGIEAGVLNSGDLKAKDGQILLTGAASHDIFTQAMNTGDMHHANSVVVAEDGSFTLSAGGTNVVNTGNVDASGDHGGEIVALGQNITNSGNIHADATNNNERAGAIELHSITTTELTENSITSTVANTSGQGGNIKLLGKNVGVLDNAQVDASGANGGGKLLIGGDKTGANPNIRNADFIYLGQNSQSRVDAIDNGDGGKLITFASDTARIYGGLSARGGALGGNGGFVETSGLRSFDIRTTPDVGAGAGNGGEWLIDPYDIRIVRGSGTTSVDETMAPTYTPVRGNARIGWDLITNILDNGGGATVTISTGTAGPVDSGNITFDLNGTPATLSYENENQTENSTLILDANRNIFFRNENISVQDSVAGLNLTLRARTGTITLDNTNFNLSGNSSNSVPLNNGSLSIEAGLENPNPDTTGAILFLNTVGIDLGGGNFSSRTRGSFSLTPDTAISRIGNFSIETTSSSNGTININRSLSIGGTSEFTTSNQQISIDNQLTIDDLATFDSGSADIVLTNRDNRFASIHITQASNVTINADSDIALGSSAASSASTINGDFEVDTTGTILQNRALNVVGNVNLTTQGNDVVLNSDGNVFNNDINITSNNGNITLRTTDITTQGSINAGSGSITLNGNDNSANIYTFDNNASLVGSSIIINGGGQADVFNINTSLSDNITINGAAGSDEFNIRANIDNLTINGNDGTDTFNIEASTGDLFGNEGDDIFNIIRQGISATIDGGIDGNDSIVIEHTSGSTWNITPTANDIDTDLTFSNIEIADGGNTDTNGNGGQDRFNISSNNVETINGRGGNDTFDLSGTEFVSNINGGPGDADVVNYQDIVGDLTVNLGSVSNTNTADGIEEYIGNYDPNNTDQSVTFSRGDRTFNDWIINGNNSGTLGDGSSTITFSNFNVLEGYTGVIDPSVPADPFNDTFTINAGASFNGIIKGGNSTNTLITQNNNQVWVLNSSNAFAGNLGTTATNTQFENIQTINGSGSDTLQFNLDSSLNITWDINTNDSIVMLEGATSPHITFNGMNAIQGRGGIDTFNINSVTQSQGLSLHGGNGNDIYNLRNINNPSSSIILDGEEGNQDQLLAANRNNDWNIGSINSLNGLITFQDIEQLTGNALQDVFTIEANTSINQINGDGGTNNQLIIANTPDNTNIWNITQDNSGSVLRRDNSNSDTSITNFSAIQNLTGGEGDDHFIIDAATGERTTLPTIGDIAGGGGAGVNELSISGTPNSNTQWNITAGNRGDIASVVTSFTNIHNITGSEGVDNFLFTTLESNITGTISGNSGSSSARDTLNIQALTNGVSVELGENVVDPNNLHVTQIETIEAVSTIDPNGENINRLIATDNRNLSWTISSINEGIIVPSTGANPQNSVEFKNFGTLVGGAGIDSFIFNNNAQDISGSIDGGSSPLDTRDSVNISSILQQNNSIIDLANNNYNNIENYIGNNRNSRIVAPSNRVNNWTFDNGTNSGNLDLNTSTSTETTFEGFANITGGDTGDIFNFTGGSLTGEILAGIGRDQLNITLTDSQTNSSRIRFIGSRDTGTNPNEQNSINISQQLGSTNSYQTSYSPQNDGSASLIYNSSDTSQQLRVLFSEVNTVNDSINVDTFTINDIDNQQDTVNILNNNIFAFNDFTPINLNGNKDNIIISGEDRDTVNISGIFSVNNRFEVQRSAVVMDTTTSTEQYIDAQVVSFIDNAQIGSDANAVQLSTRQLQLESLNGDAFIDNTNIASALDIIGINRPNGNITISADSNVNSSGDIITENALNLISSNNIILGNARHRISGPLSLETSSEAQLNTTGSLTLASIIADRLTIDTQGNITSTEDSNINITDLATFTAAREDDSSADIMLSQGTVSINGILIDKANNIELSTSSELTIDGINADGNVTFQTAGLTLNNNLTGQEIKLEANTGDIQLNAAVNAGAALNVSGNNINQSLDSAIKANSDIAFNAIGDIRQAASLSSASGDITLTSGQAITMEGASQTLAQAGSITLSAENNISITALNAEAGDVEITTRQGIADNNGDAININSQRFEAHAVNGIGVSDSIEMSVTSLMADSQANQINLSNNQELTVEHLRTNGDIDLIVSDGNILLDNTPDIAFDPDINDANTPGAIVNAGYNQGSINITLGTGSLLALGPRNLSQPDIVARQGAVINFPPGEIGSSSRPLVMYIRDSLTFDGFRSWAPVFAFGVRPEEFNNNSTIQLDIRQLLQSGGELLNEVEALEDVNPAVFTDVKNFTYESLSIRMPRDQVYDEDLLKTYDDDTEEQTNYY